METEVLGVMEEGINTSRMTVVAGDTGLELRVMALEDIYVVLELKEVSMMLTRKALAKGTVLNKNPVVNFKIRELEEESSELKARGLVWGAKRVDCQRKVTEMKKISYNVLV